MSFLSKPRSVRGQNIISRLQFIKSRELRWPEVLMKLPADCKHELEGMIKHGLPFEEFYATPDHMIRAFSSTGWYPCIIINSLIDVSTSLLEKQGLTSVEINRAAGRVSGQIHLNSFLSHVITWGSPQMALGIMYKAWDQLFSGGSLKVIKNEYGYSEVQIQCDFLSPLVQHIIHGFIEEYFKIKNITDFQIQSAYASHLGGTFYYKVKWKA